MSRILPNFSALILVLVGAAASWCPYIPVHSGGSATQEGEFQELETYQ